MGKIGKMRFSFNTQPPEGGWIFPFVTNDFKSVSTHSRLKAAGCIIEHRITVSIVSTHSRPKAAGSCR